MNVRPGDLAIVVKVWARGEAHMPSLLPTLGRIVRVVRLVECPNSRWTYWQFDKPILLDREWLVKGLPDDCLRPIRDTDGQDETAGWKREAQARETTSWLESQPWQREVKA